MAGDDHLIERAAALLQGKSAATGAGSTDIVTPLNRAAPRALVPPPHSFAIEDLKPSVRPAVTESPGALATRRG